MTDKWIEEFLFPEKALEASGRQPLNFDYIHEELAKPNVTLSLLHHEYEAECRANNKIPYSYRSILRHLVDMQISIKQPYEFVESLEKSWKLIGQDPHPSSLIAILGKK